MGHYLNENNCSLTNNLEGKGLKHYGCELCSAISLETIYFLTIVSSTSIKSRSMKQHSYKLCLTIFCPDIKQKQTDFLRTLFLFFLRWKHQENQTFITLVIFLISPPIFSLDCFILHIWCVTFLGIKLQLPSVCGNLYSSFIFLYCPTKHLLPHAALLTIKTFLSYDIEQRVQAPHLLKNSCICETSFVPRVAFQSFKLLTFF